MKKKCSPFEVEYLRQNLAIQHKYKELLETYSDEYLEISNLNSPLLWDELNETNENIVNKNNPMVLDRILTATKLLPRTNSKILNIGVGTGNLEKAYFTKVRKQVNWIGIDISPKSIKKIKKTLSQGKYQKGNILNLKFKKTFFDYAVALEVLEHISPSSTFKALTEIKRVLKKNGKFILSVPLNENLEHMILIQKTNPNAHIRIYTPDLIKAELELAGFKILKEKQLFAFNSMYAFKTFIVKNLLHNFRSPNNILIFAEKR